MAPTNATDLYFVHHEIVDADAWGEFYSQILGECKVAKSASEVWAKPVWKGNTCSLTVNSACGKYAFCLWNVPEGTTQDEFQTFIDGFTGKSAKNTPAKVESSFGFSCLNDVTYMKDMIQYANTGKVLSYAGQGDVFFVYHKAEDKEKWGAFFKHAVDVMADCKTIEDINVAWKVHAGFSPLGNIGLSNGDAICLWEGPMGATTQDFQEMIDAFATASKNESVFKAGDIANGRLLHKDFYAADAIAYAKSLTNK